MTIKTTYSRARERFADLWRAVEEDRDAVIISRRGHADVALVAADELAGLLETAHLLRSPKNARRLMSALRRALRGGGRSRSLNELKQEMAIDREAE
ncbi:MAG TPA: type II toxin-antitoxin system prevent-host-death family antitoxin [Vicinamibacteria bacterium]|nr:type II toxin-antitoxin system prevent-host-death family antitoxin [Vicinamibacteria bacterium]